VKPNIGNLMKQAQKMQAEMAKVQEELKEERVEASTGGGMVKVVMTGDLAIESVTIDPAAVDPDDVAMLQDMVTAAVNEALRMAQDLSNQKMSQVTGGLGLPGMM
jgi:DNA-binding YbaB/EbfC family protein